MTDERIQELMEKKGFRTNGSDEDCYYKSESPVLNNCESPVLICVDYWCYDGAWRVHAYAVGVRNLILFANPIAAATYANRVVIPALLAGKESA